MARGEYAEVLRWLYGLEAARGMDFKLERVALALESLGEPQRRYPCVHIAGTNGKGSVAAMLHAMLSAAGYRVGLYTSPHLLHLTERIRVGPAAVTEDEVVDLVHAVRTAATVRGIELTFFEFVTVMGFLSFARHAVDVAVVEVGLGGRLDATNVIEPEVAVITTIGLDHQEYLGNTIAAIAREKGGIIKSRRPVIVGRVDDEAATVLANVAAQHDASAVWLGRDFSLTNEDPCRFVGLGSRIDDIQVALRGAHQRDNAATAVAAALHVRGGLHVPDDAIRRGLAQVYWPGRLEVVRHAPLIVLDGAHNPAGMAVLVRELPAIIGDRRLHVVFGVMRDKRWNAMVRALAPRAAAATLTSAAPERGEDPAALAHQFARYCPVTIAPDPVAGVTAAVDGADDGDAILVTGSLFLVGAVYPYVVGCSAQVQAGATHRPRLHP